MTVVFAHLLPLKRLDARLECQQKQEIGNKRERLRLPLIPGVSGFASWGRVHASRDERRQSRKKPACGVSHVYAIETTLGLSRQWLFIVL